MEIVQLQKHIKTKQMYVLKNEYSKTTAEWQE